MNSKTNDEPQTEEIMITRKQLLFRIAIFMLFVSLLFITIFVIKLIKYCGIPVGDYEVVEANVVQYEVRDVGLEGFPRKPYENDYIVTVRYNDYVSQYKINDSYVPMYSAAYEYKTTVSVYLYDGELYVSEDALRLSQNGGAADSKTGFMVFAIISCIVDILLWGYYHDA